VEVELAEVEASLTEEHKKLATEYFDKLDDAGAIRFANDKEYRCKILKGLRDDPDNSTLLRPKTLWPEKSATPPPNGDDVYADFKKKVGVMVPGPAGASRRGVKTPAAGGKQQASWLNGN